MKKQIEKKLKNKFEEKKLKNKFEEKNWKKHLEKKNLEKKNLENDNIVVMWIVLIRENVTAGVSGRIDKGTEERLEMMWCQHVCHSCRCTTLCRML